MSEHDEEAPVKRSESKWARRRRDRLAAGLCQDCGGEKEDKGRPTCTRCRGLRNKAQMRKTVRRRIARRCTICNGSLPEDRDADTCTSCISVVSNRARLRRKEIKLGVIEMFGAACGECGESDPRTLTLHHVNGDGGKHKKELGVSAGSIAVWTHVYRSHQSGEDVGYELELLCYNCHLKIDLAPWWTEHE